MAPSLEDRFDDVPETYFFDKEGEFDFIIQSAEKKDTKNGEREMLEISFIVDDGSGEEYSPIRQWFVLPNEDDFHETNQQGKPKAQGMLRSLRRLLYAFGIPKSTDLDDCASVFPGSKGRGRNRMEASDNNPEVKFPRLSFPAVPRGAEW